MKKVVRNWQKKGRRISMAESLRPNRGGIGYAQV